MTVRIPQRLLPSTAAGHFAVYAIRRYWADHMFRNAAALAYASLLSLVPLLAVGLGMLAAFPAFAPMREHLRQTIFELFLPDVGVNFADRLTDFINAAGGLTMAGALGLIVSAGLLLNTVVEALNAVFGVTRMKPLSERLLLYWAALTLFPLLVGASLSLSGYLSLVSEWAGHEGLDGLGDVVAALAPTVLTTLAFALLYLLVPNRPVRVRHALAGGIFAALLFAVLRYGFALYVIRADVYRTLYGALAALPIFLAWLYLSWVVVLAGAVVTASLPEWQARSRRGECPVRGNFDLSLAVEAMAVVWRDAATGKVTQREDLLAVTAAAERELSPLLERLIARGYLVATADGGLAPLRLAEATTLHDLAGAIGFTLATDERLDPRLAPFLAETEAAMRRAMDVTMAEVLGGKPGAARGNSV